MLNDSSLNLFSIGLANNQSSALNAASVFSKGDPASSIRKVTGLRSPITSATESSTASQSTKLHVAGENVAPARTLSPQKTKAARLAQLSDEIVTTTAKYNEARTGIDSLQQGLDALAGLAGSVAQNENIDHAQKQTIQVAFDTAVTEFNSQIDRTEFNGQKLIDGSEGSLATVEKLTGLDLSTASSAQDAEQQIQAASDSLLAAAEKIQSDSNSELSSLRAQLTGMFSGQLSDSLANAIRPEEQGHGINAESISDLIERQSAGVSLAHDTINSADVLALISD